MTAYTMELLSDMFVIKRQFLDGGLLATLESYVDDYICPIHF